MTKTNFAIGASVFASLALAGAAWAQHAGNAPTTRAEAQAHAVQMFGRLDSNRDGRLDTADRTAHQTAMFDRVDTDRNGSISREEFNAAHAGHGGHGAEAGGEHAEDGQHGGGAMRHGRMGRGGMMMVRMADANRDGAVTQDEFSTAALAHFDRADADHNGTLSAEERRAAHSAMREHRREGRGHDGQGHDGHPAATPGT